MVVVKYNKGCMIFVILKQLGLVKCRWQIAVIFPAVNREGRCGRSRRP